MGTLAGECDAPPILVVMLDGIGDRPWSEIGDRTPLQAADTPSLDAFAAASATGILHTLGPGRAPGTDLAHFALLGYPPELYPGRAALEAAGAGIDVPPGSVALHAIFATVRREADGSLTILERYPHGPEGEIARMAELIGRFEKDGLVVTLTHAGGEEAIVTVASVDGMLQPSEDITDTDPHNNGWPAGTVKALRDARDPEAAEATARVLSAYLAHAYESMRRHVGATDATGAECPFLLLKWTARPRVLPPFREHTGMRGCIVSSSRIFEGLTRALGMEHRSVPSLVDIAEDTAARLAEGARALAEGADFVLVHSKEPDKAGHRKNPALKRDVIAAIDKGLAGLANRRTGDLVLPPDTIVVVTGDHGTPAGTSLIHSGDPVPLAVLSAAARVDAVAAFDELACSRGSLGHLRGEDFLPVLLNLRGTVRYTGGRLTPHTGLSWPRDYEPFRVE